MIDKRRLNKVIDSNKMVFECMHCGRRIIEDRYNKPEFCPQCNKENTMVVNGNLIVTK